MRFRFSIVILALTLSGCGLLQTSVEPPVVEPLPAPPAPAPQPEPEAPVAEPPPAPRPAPAPEPAPALFKIAVVLSSRAPAYTGVADALADLIDDVEVYDLTDRSLSPRDAFAAIHDSAAGAVVAIGLRAAVYARDYAAIPVVFSQVFNDTDHGLLGERVRGVSAIPPLSAQLAAWLEIAPDMQAVGAIIGSGHERLIAEAIAAATEHGLDFKYQTAASDRETLYLFTRMAPAIDGFWLFPDNRILSVAVLRELFEHATRRGVQIAVFNDALLELGASLSSTTLEEDIAATLVSILEAIQRNGVDDVQAFTPLHGIRIQVNTKLQNRLQSTAGASAGASP